MSSDRRPETAILPQREKWKSAEAKLSVVLCCLYVCARLPPGRCSCHCTSISSKENHSLKQNTPEKWSRILQICQIHPLIYVTCIFRGYCYEALQLSEDPGRMQGCTPCETPRGWTLLQNLQNTAKRMSSWIQTYMGLGSLSFRNNTLRLTTNYTKKIETINDKFPGLWHCVIKH